MVTCIKSKLSLSVMLCRVKLIDINRIQLLYIYHINVSSLITGPTYSPLLYNLGLRYFILCCDTSHIG